MKKQILNFVLVLGSCGLSAVADAGGGTLNSLPPSHQAASYPCPKDIAVAADFYEEGRLEVSARAAHASMYVRSVSMCHYRVDSLTVQGERAEAVEDLQFELQSGRVFLSLLTADGEKVRFSTTGLPVGGRTRADFYVVTGFTPKELYLPTRHSTIETSEIAIAPDKVLVPVQ